MDLHYWRQNDSQVKLANPGEMNDFLDCLMANIEAFSKDDYDLGLCTITAPPLLTVSEVPIQARPFRTPEKYRSEIKKQIDKMLEAGVIKESTTPWVSNLVVVKKSNGQLRPCVDFRPLNKITINDPFPLPRMDDIIHKISGKSFYSTLDLASGFWQIPLDSASSYKCGLITEWGLFQMCRLPFGLKNAPSIFQRIMSVVLKDVANVTVYIDDIVVHNDDFASHLQTLEIVFKRMKELD